jgi:peptidoglycan/LPS O-acetylase OafA/YrhL
MDRHRDPALDGIRALAALAVMAFHLRVPGFSGGYIGVDIFFVLSGYLITTLLRSGPEHFYERRMRRLYPALLTMLVAYALLAQYFWPERSAGNVMSDVLGAGTYLSDYLVKPGVWPLRHTWSLAIEAQFYLLWPFVVRRLPDRLAPAVLGATWLGLTLWRIAVVRLWGTDAAYYHLDSHSTGLVLGALLSYAPSRPAYYAWPGVAVLAILVVALAQAGKWSMVFGLSLAELGAALLIIGTLDLRPTVLRTFLGNRFVAGFGLISYGVYLWHYPMAIVARLIWPWQISLPIVFALSTALAAASYMSVERIFRLTRRKPALA